MLTPVLRFTGGVGQTYALERSANLADWEIIAQPGLIHAEQNVIEWIDPDPPVGGQFYRILTLTP